MGWGEENSLYRGKESGTNEFFCGKKLNLHGTKELCISFRDTFLVTVFIIDFLYVSLNYKNSL